MRGGKVRTNFLVYRIQRLVCGWTVFQMFFQRLPVWEAVGRYPSKSAWPLLSALHVVGWLPALGNCTTLASTPSATLHSPPLCPGPPLSGSS